MTISSTTNRAQFNCNGSTTSFPFTFKYLADSDLQVYLSSPAGVVTLLTLNVDYEITPAVPGPGGTLSFLGTYLSSPPVSGYTLTILRFIARTQEVDFINGDSLDENNIEGMGDKLTMMVQDLDERIGRAVTVPPSSGISNISVPDPVAGAFLRWNLSGDGLENATYVDPTLITISDYWRAVIDGGDTLPEALTAMGLDPSLSTLTLPDNVTISDFIKTLLDDADAAAARATLQIPAASESVAGIIELATHAETDAGTDDARAVTPDKLYNTPGIFRKNLLHNGGAQVVQRASLSISSAFAIGACDRWLMFYTSASGSPSGTGTYSTGYGNLRTGRALAATSISCTGANTLNFGQRIEYLDGALVRAALTDGRKLSFQCKIYHDIGSAQTISISISTANAQDNFSAITSRYSSGTVSCASGSWTTAKFEGFSPTNTDFEKGFVIYIGLSTPASMSGKNVAIGDIQLEIGDKCTDVEYRPMAEELTLCQRYYEKSYDLGTAAGSTTLIGAPIQHGGGSILLTGASFKVRKRAIPTVVIYSPYDGASDRVAYYNVNDAYGSYWSPCYGSSISEAGFNMTGPASGFSSSYMFRFHWTASAEL